MSEVTKPLLFERFDALNDFSEIQHAFTRRIPGIDVSQDKAEALRRREVAHLEIRRQIGMENWPLFTAEQVHGDKIAIVDFATSDKEFADCDALITKARSVALGIHVADCCAVYIIDPTTPAIGLVHSGKKGTALGIAAKAIRQMKESFGSNPADMIVQLSPCIRPPHYEIDFASDIVKQCRAQGVKQIHDSGVCTACHTDSYYSYRAEKGKTGRMLALLGLKL